MCRFPLISWPNFKAKCLVTFVRIAQILKIVISPKRLFFFSFICKMFIFLRIGSLSFVVPAQMSPVLQLGLLCSSPRRQSNRSRYWKDGEECRLENEQKEKWNFSSVSNKPQTYQKSYRQSEGEISCRQRGKHERFYFTRRNGKRRYLWVEVPDDLFAIL